MSKKKTSTSVKEHSWTATEIAEVEEVRRVVQDAVRAFYNKVGQRYWDYNVVFLTEGEDEPFSELNMYHSISTELVWLEDRKRLGVAIRLL